MRVRQWIDAKIRTSVGKFCPISQCWHSPFCSVEDNKEDDKMADLLSDFQQQLTLQESSVKLCQPEVDVSQTHISGMN